MHGFTNETTHNNKHVAELTYINTYLGYCNHFIFMFTKFI